MTYSGFGIQPHSTIRKPKQVFKPIFEQIASGEHPIKSENNSQTTSWSQLRHHFNQEEKYFSDVENRVKLVSAIAFLTMIIVSMI